MCAGGGYAEHQNPLRGLARLLVFVVAGAGGPRYPAGVPARYHRAGAERIRGLRRGARYRPSDPGRQAG